MTGFLDQKDYAKVIECAPVLCVDVDLVTPDGKHVLFRRCNEPLKGEWWVIGGRVWKGEDPVNAARRKLREETGLDFKPDRLTFVGYYNEVFEFSSLGRGKYHTVSLVYRATITAVNAVRLDAQHSDWTLADRLPNGFTANLLTEGAR